MTDTELISLFYERSEKAIKEMSAKYGRLCEKLILNILGNRCDTEECMNDVNIKVWNSIPPAKPENFSAYISKVARNTALNRYKSQHRQKRGGIYNICAELTDCMPSEETIENSLENRMISGYINEFLGTIDKTDRIAFVLRYYYGESIDSIAGSMNETCGNIRSKLHRTRKKLAHYLSERGVEV